jgi:hypothetical protein
MPLPTPKIPVYTTTLPISKKVVKYRPFLVKEEKIILLAMTAEDPSELIEAMKQIVSLCTEGTVRPEKISLTDLNYLMIKIRACSKGEIIELVLKCKNSVPQEDNEGGTRPCGYSNEVSVNLNDAVVSSNIPEKKIEINDTMGVIMKPITLSVLDGIDVDDSPTQSLIRSIINSIDTIYDGEEIFSSEDYTTEEIVTFVDSLTQDQLRKMVDYVENQPNVKIDIDYKCGSCGVERKIEVDNIQDFLD